VGADRREAIERLFVQYGRGVGSYVLARLGDAELAEEITSRVFLTVVRQFDKCRGSAVGWLWAIVRSELARHFRRRRRLVPLGDDPVDLADSPPQELARREMQQQIRAAMAELSDQQQQIIGMKFFLQVRNKEIAEALGISANQVGVKVHRALRQLRDLMDPTPVSETDD